MMTQNEYNFWKADRAQKILQIYKEYDLENKAYISFSGCPYSLTLEKDLEVMKSLLPIDYYSANSIFGKVYDFYKAVGYRLKK